MRAVVFDGQLRVVADRAAVVTRADEVVIDVGLAGICQTDIEITRGYMGFRGVPGHEFVGRVSAAGGEAGRQWVGRRVVGEINCVCGRCEMCQAGLKSHCLERTVLGISGRDGCMCEQCVLPVDNLHLVPEELSDEQAVLVEPLAAAYQVVQQVRINPCDNVVVIGDGRLGQLVAQVQIGRAHV